MTLLTLHPISPVYSTRARARVKIERQQMMHTRSYDAPKGAIRQKRHFVMERGAQSNSRAPPRAFAPPESAAKWREHEIYHLVLRPNFIVVLR